MSERIIEDKSLTAPLVSPKFVVPDSSNNYGAPSYDLVAQQELREIKVLLEKILKVLEPGVALKALEGSIRAGSIRAGRCVR